MNRYKALLFLILSSVSAVGAMERDAREIQYEIEVKQHVKADPKAVIPRLIHTSLPAVQFIVPERGSCTFTWGTAKYSDTPIYNACFAEELAPFVFGNKDIRELQGCVLRYPGTDSDVIEDYIRQIRDHRQQPSRQAENLRAFVTRYSAQANQVQSPRINPLMLRYGVYAGVALMAAAGIVYGVYHFWFVDKADGNGAEQANELQENNEGVSPINTKPIEA